MAKGKKNTNLNDYANAASAAGLTYGQKQAQEYASAVKIRPIPPEYRKMRKKLRKPV
ncbi:MAG: hypothetical protein J1E83_12730 [Lachnospiraceae bacterium]|nr:hypothetical protein [Lachnospiraceae bacterium]